MNIIKTILAQAKEDAMRAQEFKGIDSVQYAYWIGRTDRLRDTISAFAGSWTVDDQLEWHEAYKEYHEFIKDLNTVAA